MSILLGSYHHKFLAGNGWKCNILIWNQLFLKKEGPFFIFPSKSHFGHFWLFFLFWLIYLPFCDRQHSTFLYGRTHIILYGTWYLIFGVYWCRTIKIFVDEARLLGSSSWGSSVRPHPSSFGIICVWVVQIWVFCRLEDGGGITFGELNAGVFTSLLLS